MSTHLVSDGLIALLLTEQKDTKGDGGVGVGVTTDDLSKR